jgi:hypothetical protein
MKVLANFFLCQKVAAQCPWPLYGKRVHRYRSSFKLELPSSCICHKRGLAGGECMAQWTLPLTQFREESNVALVVTMLSTANYRDLIPRGIIILQVSLIIADLEGSW